MTLEEFEDANLGQPMTKEDYLVMWARCYLSQTGGNMPWVEDRHEELWNHFKKWITIEDQIDQEWLFSKEAILK